MLIFHGSHTALSISSIIQDRTCNLIYAKKMILFQPFALKGESSEQVIDLVEWLHFWTAPSTWIKGLCPWEGTPHPRGGWQGWLTAALTLRDGHLAELDVVHHRADLPVLEHGVSRHLTEVHHPWGQRRRGLSVCS